MPEPSVFRHVKGEPGPNEASASFSPLRPIAADKACASLPYSFSWMRLSAHTVKPSFSQKSSMVAFVTRFPVQLCASSCASTLTSERSPASSVGVTKVRRGFSMPP